MPELPELPEVETARAVIERAALGRRIVAVDDSEITPAQFRALLTRERRPTLAPRSSARMVHGMRPAVILAALTIVGAVGAVPVTASATSSDSFFAVASGGTGTACTVGRPCTLANAITAASNDTTGSPVVEIESGTYQHVHVTITKPMKLENADLRDPAPVLHGDGAHPVITVKTTMAGITGIDATGGTDGLLVQSGGIGTVTNSRFYGNSDDGVDDRGTAPFDGYQGVTADGNGASGIAATGVNNVLISGSTVSNNSGDGITAQSDDFVRVDVQNSTVYGNHQNGVIALSGAQLHLTFSSVLGNGGNGLHAAADLITIGAVILAGNDAGAAAPKECGPAFPLVDDANDNIADDTSCMLNSGHSTVDTTAAFRDSIGTLGTYGGPSDTVPLTNNSPAVGFVTTPPTNGINVCGKKDQRGLSRPDPCTPGAFDPLAALLPSTVTLSASPGPAAGAAVGDQIRLTATVTGGVGPAGGGTVDFASGPANGGLSPIMTCNGHKTHIPVVDGTATCVVRPASVGTFQFGASLSGSQTYNDGVTTPIPAYQVFKNPTLVAHLSSTAKKTKYGWYRAPVKVSWTCTAGSGTLVGSCPAGTTLSASKAKQSVTKTIRNSVGGSVTVKSPAVNIDRAKPTITITGVKSGHTYPHNTKVTPKCVAKDGLSGPAGRCTIKTTHKSKAGKVAYTLTATVTDKADNKTVKTVTWAILA